MEEEAKTNATQTPVLRKMQMSAQVLFLHFTFFLHPGGSVAMCPADASVALLGAVLGSVEALVLRLAGEGWQNQDLPSPPHCLDNTECDEYGRTSDAHGCDPQVRTLRHPAFLLLFLSL